MLSLNSLPKIKGKRKKRLGRGYGSGKGGHTSSRGQKGQKTRGKISPLFEGTKNKKSLIQRLPILRGKGKLKAKKEKFVVPMGKLEVFESNAIIDVEALKKHKLVPDRAERRNVKIVQGGKLAKKLVVKVPVTKNAAQAIVAAGGNVE